MKQLKFIVPAFVIGLLAALNAPSIKKILFPPSRFEVALKKVSDTLLNNPKFKERVQGMDEEQGHAFGQQSAHLGLKRLDTASLIQWNNLKVNLAQKSFSLCAGFWSGKSKTEELVKALELLEGHQMEDWMELSTKAGLLEIEKAAFTPATENALQNGFSQISLLLKDEDQARFQANLAKGNDISDEESCWTTKTLLSKVNELKDADKVDFLRALAAL